MAGRSVARVLAVLAVLLAAAPALAQKRVALIIANGAYAKVPKLVNPPNDAAAIEALLKQAGFDKVVRATDLSAVQMRRTLRDFSDEVRDADIAVVFYAGHGIEVNGVNYLIPVDAVLERDIDVADEAIALDRVNTVLEPAKRLRLVILDACRDNPFVRSIRRTLAGRSIGRGLAPVEVSTTDTLIAYAAKAGSTAADGDGANSPYTAAMLKHLATPGLDVRLALGRVRDEVLRATSRRQEPFLYGSLGGAEVPLVAGRPVEAPAKGPAAGASPAAAASAAAEAWAHAKDSRSIAELEAFVRRFGDTYFGEIAKGRLEEMKREAETQRVAMLQKQQEESAVRKRAEEEAKRDPLLALAPGSGQAARDRQADGQPCSMCPEMVVVPAGRFTMGSPDSEPERSSGEAQVAVTIAHPFAVGRFAVTFDEWDACVAAGGCNGHNPEDRDWGRGKRPVINVNWDDAKAYVAWLSKKTGKSYRLLSEAEREYVTRAGTTTPFWWGKSITPAQANYNELVDPYKPGGSRGEYRQRTAPVDSFAANLWGLHNVHGNVWEWTEDCWNDSNVGNPGDGSARTGGDCSRRVLRGGSWNHLPRNLRAAFRDWYLAVDRFSLIGFRVTRSVSR